MNVAAAVTQHHTNTGIAIELIASAVLWEMAASVHDLIDVQRPNCPPSPTSLFMAIIAGSGEGKDTGSAAFLTPLYAIQVVADREYAQLQEQHVVDMEVWKAESDALKNAMKKDLKSGGSPEAHKALLMEHQKRRPAPPRAPKLIYDDTTVSSLMVALCDRWRSGTVVSLEGGSFFNGRLRANIPWWNKVWDGQPIQLDRLTGGSKSCRSPRVSKFIGIQPEAFLKFLLSDGPDAHAIGYTARILMVMPQSTNGYRFLDGAGKLTNHIEVFTSRSTELLRASVVSSRAGDQDREVIRFSASAASAFTALYNEMQASMQPGGSLSHISGHAAKAAEMVARVAAIIHKFNDLPDDISLETVKWAEDIVKWYLEEFLHIHAASSPEAQAAQDAFLVEQALAHAYSKQGIAIPQSELRFWCPPHLQGARLAQALGFAIRNGRVLITTGHGRSYIRLVSHAVPLTGMQYCSPLQLPGFGST